MIVDTPEDAAFAVAYYLPPAIADAITTAPTWPHYAALLVDAYAPVHAHFSARMVGLNAKLDINTATAAWVADDCYDPARWLYENLRSFR